MQSSEPDGAEAGTREEPLKEVVPAQGPKTDSLDHPTRLNKNDWTQHLQARIH